MATATTRQKYFTNIPKDDKPIKVFDVKKKELIATYNNLTECTAALGVNESTLLCALQCKRKNRTNNLNKVLAFRYV